MKKINHLALLLSFTIVCALFSAACSDGASSVAEGETYISLRLTGETLSGPVEFDGKSEGPFFAGYTSTSVLGDISLKSVDERFTLVRATFSVESTSETTFDAGDFDLDIVIEGFTNSDGATVSYSLRPIDGEGTLEMVVRTDDRLHLKLNSKFAPTRLSAKDLVFELEGEIIIQD